MRVAVLLSDMEACGTYRLVWPAQAVKAAHPDWDITIYKPNTVGFYVDRSSGALMGVSGLPPVGELDLLVTQRVGKRIVVDLMRQAQAAGCAVVLDNDDAMWAIDRKNVAWAAWNSREHHWRVTDEAAEVADLCTVTTDLLARRYGGGRSAVIPNVVPERVLDCAPPAYEMERERPTVGWFGQLVTHPGDPNVVGSAMREVVEATSCEVVVQPDADALTEVWGLPEPARRVPPAALGPDYYTGLRELDVALVPLATSTFNKAKSSLKALECSAAGCAVVATPTPANRELARSLPILLAASPAEWRQHVQRLLLDPDERRQRAEQARSTIRDSWTFESQAERWASVWERAVNRRTRLLTSA